MNYSEKYIKTLKNMIPYSPVNKKIRIGRNGDGGYVVIDGYTYDSFISAGISNEITFEIDFLQRYPNIPSVAFDGTVGRPQGLPENIIFHKKNIGVTNTDQTTNLKDIIDYHSDVFVKMDIEGEEWRWINSMSDSIRNIKQIVFEAHAFFPHLLSQEYILCHCLGQTPDVWTDYILNGLIKLNETHYLVHVHENVYGPFVYVMDNNYPTFYELTYIRKDCEVNGLNTENLPIPLLDYPTGQSNMGGTIDKPLNFWPFKF